VNKTDIESFAMKRQKSITFGVTVKIKNIS